jgi:hypothetical protein
VISEIESGARYNLRVAGMPIPVEVLVARHGRRKYLKSVVDGLHPDSLLALPRCSVGPARHGAGSDEGRVGGSPVAAMRSDHATRHGGGGGLVPPGARKAPR